MLSSLTLLMTVLVLILLHSYLVLFPLHILNRALHLVLKLIALVSLHRIDYHQAPFIGQQFKPDSSLGWVHAPDLHIFEFELLFDFDFFGHKLVLKVDGNDCLSTVRLVVRAVTLFKIVLSTVDSAKFGQFLLREHRRHNKGYDFGLAFLGVALPEEHDVDVARFDLLHVLLEAFGGLGPDHFGLVDTDLDALL